MASGVADHQASSGNNAGPAVIVGGVADYRAAAIDYNARATIGDGVHLFNVAAFSDVSEAQAGDIDSEIPHSTHGTVDYGDVRAVSSIHPVTCAGGATDV